jgi:hypothetical protein
MKQPKLRNGRRSPITYGLVTLLGLSLLLVLAYPVYVRVLLAGANQPRVRQIALADLNGNGHLDAIVGIRGLDEVCFNDGQGNFSDSRQRLGDGLTRLIVVADLNDDGLPDLVIDSENKVQIWLNSGEGRFIVGQSFDYEQGQAMTVGDVTGNVVSGMAGRGQRPFYPWPAY